MNHKMGVNIFLRFFDSSVNARNGHVYLRFAQNGAVWTGSGYLQKRINRCFVLQNFRITKKSGNIFSAYWKYFLVRHSSEYETSDKFENAIEQKRYKIEECNTMADTRGVRGAVAPNNRKLKVCNAGPEKQQWLTFLTIYFNVSWHLSWSSVSILSW